MMTIPFIVYGLPRSRTAWIAKFLTYKDWECGHEQAMYMRNMEDVRAFFAQSSIGTAETAASYGRDLIRHAVPNIKEMVILRPVDEVIESVMRIDISKIGFYDRCRLRKGMEYGNRMLQKIAKDPNVLVIHYADLVNEETCAKVFEYCLPYKFDKAWWESLHAKNVQIDTPALLKYRAENRLRIDTFKRHCKDELRRLVRAGAISVRRMA